MRVDTSGANLARQSYIDKVERFFLELDQKLDLDVLAAFFQPEAMFVIRPSTRAEGRSAITEMFRASFEDTATRLRHYVSRSEEAAKSDPG